MVPSPGRASPVVASVQSHKNFVDHADLEIVPSHENSVDLHSVYMAHVLERSRQSIVVDILDYNIPESTFADCLLPTGHMHTDVFYLQCQLLSKDWKDKVILSWKATVSVSKNLAWRLFLCYYYLYLTVDIFITQQELIHQDIGVKELDKELTAEVMNKVDLVCALFYITVEFFQIDSRVCAFFRYLFLSFMPVTGPLLFFPLPNKRHISLTPTQGTVGWPRMF
jgi:hypothetical protein